MQNQPGTIESEQGQPEPPAQYIVEKIVGKRMRGGIVQCNIKWLGYPSSKNTWEPLDQILKAHILVQDSDNKAKRTKRIKKQKKLKPPKTSLNNQKQHQKDEDNCQEQMGFNISKSSLRSAHKRLFKEKQSKIKQLPANLNYRTTICSSAVSNTIYEQILKINRVIKRVGSAKIEFNNRVEQRQEDNPFCHQHPLQSMAIEEEVEPALRNDLMEQEQVHQRWSEVQIQCSQGKSLDGRSIEGYLQKPRSGSAPLQMADLKIQVQNDSPYYDPTQNFIQKQEQCLVHPIYTVPPGQLNLQEYLNGCKLNLSKGRLLGVGDLLVNVHVQDEVKNRSSDYVVKFDDLKKHSPQVMPRFLESILQFK